MNIWRFCVRTALAFSLAGLAVSAYAQQKEIKIGVIYDYTGPLAAGGECVRRWRHCPSSYHSKVGSILPNLAPHTGPNSLTG